MSNETSSTPKPPYLPFRTFDNFITELEGGPIPARIDKYALAKKSGSVQSWLPIALQFFGLTDAAGHPTDNTLEKLVNARGEARKALYATIVRDVYSDLFATIDMGRGAQGQLLDWFKNQGYSMSTAMRCAGFFLDICKASDISVSPHFKKVSPPRAPRKNGVRSKKTDDAEFEESDELSDTAALDSIPALQDKLIIGLVERLPGPGVEFPKDKRDLWFATAQMVFEMVYGKAEDK